MEQTGETEVEPELEQAKRKLSEGQIHRNGLEQSFVCGFEGMSNIFKKMILDSSMVEHSAVNRRVVGSSPTRGVDRQIERFAVFFIAAESRRQIMFMISWLFYISCNQRILATSLLQIPSYDCILKN